MFRLYISGATPRSTAAVKSVREICRRHLEEGDSLQIIDVYQQPALAAADEIVVTPTLVRKLPEPARRFSGDMSDASQLMAVLGLGERTKGAVPPAPLSPP